MKLTIEWYNEHRLEFERINVERVDVEMDEGFCHELVDSTEWALKAFYAIESVFYKLDRALEFDSWDDDILKMVDRPWKSTKKGEAKR